ncbi:hypothetical protein CFC21_025028 [Triticum aestivum]|uniref:BURP domain-containing protein n=3 Tax=Triticum TaxID=4564 RepID=A0A9R1PWJ5_TRITD|nr:BURP domain-containing protein 4-like [Triticum aestivum]KAF7010632.1 hypothetical protein CFC21_025028 [Triticum aestivum]VAH50987.1 unnamed protein product [Triticum turgidum subsp. durum]
MTIMRMFLALCALGFVAGVVEDGSSFDVSAYPVKWDEDPSVGSGDVAAPPSPGTEAPAPPPKHHMMVKKGMLFLERDLFAGALLPANTRLGYVRRTSSPGPVISSTTSPVPPFRYSSFEKILKFYNVTHGSKQAGRISETLQFCEEAGDKEPHVCATSVAAAREFAATVLGTKEPRAVTSTLHGRTEPLRYVVAPNGIASVGGDAVVPCHPLAYPVEVFYCHNPSNVQALRVQLVGQEDPSVGATAIAVCHKDTGDWDEAYFVMLNGSRGEPICHFMPANYLLWL